MISFSLPSLSLYFALAIMLTSEAPGFASLAHWKSSKPSFWVSGKVRGTMVIPEGRFSGWKVIGPVNPPVRLTRTYQAAAIPGAMPALSSSQLTMKSGSSWVIFKR